jgi:dCTP deaminase
MSVLSDIEIKQLANNSGMIVPFVDSLIKNEAGIKILSYGLSSYGYDVRVDNKFFLFNKKNQELVIDPKNIDTEVFEEITCDVLTIPPNGFVLAKTVEYLKIPKDVISICVGKSTYARCGVIINVTPIEPEWEGYVTLEISNTTPLPVKIYANEGICQFLFLKASSVCEQSYLDRSGKYLYQKDITLPKV